MGEFYCANRQDVIRPPGTTPRTQFAGCVNSTLWHSTSDLVAIDVVVITPALAALTSRSGAASARPIGGLGRPGGAFISMNGDGSPPDGGSSQLASRRVLLLGATVRPAGDATQPSGGNVLPFGGVGSPLGAATKAAILWGAVAGGEENLIRGTARVHVGRESVDTHDVARAGDRLVNRRFVGARCALQSGRS
jgi:hypothetical protein